MDEPHGRLLRPGTGPGVDAWQASTMTLVLEIGWTEDATNVVVVDTAAHSKVGEGRAAHPAPTDGLVDPTTWWAATVEATRHAVDGLTAIGLQASDLRTVLVAPGTPTGGLVALDSDGAPVHDAVVGSHRDSGADADWLIGHVDGGREAWLAATDLLPTAGSTVALLSWLHRSAPEAWAAATRFTLPAGFLLEGLGGDAAVSTHDAVGTAVLDHHSGERWRHRAARRRRPRPRLARRPAQGRSHRIGGRPGGRCQSRGARHPRRPPAPRRRCRGSAERRTRGPRCGRPPDRRSPQRRSPDGYPAAIDTIPVGHLAFPGGTYRSGMTDGRSDRPTQERA